MSKPQAIICDIDGTLAHMDGKRTPYEYDKVGEDSVDETVRHIVNIYDIKFDIVLMSGREDSCREETEQWLIDNQIPHKELLMRSAGDYRQDYVVKKELYEMYVKDEYEILFVLDDRDQVVEMWRAQGLKCLQVQEGNF